MRNPAPLPLLGILLTTLAPSVARSADAIEVDPLSQASLYDFRYRGKTVMQYAFSPVKYKPYIKVLSTLRGENVLRDAPFDHLHHHALMYGIMVNGVNFWEEISGAGVQKTVRISYDSRVDPAGPAEATIHHVLHWVAAQDAFLPDTNAPTLLLEKRTLKLTVDPAQGEVAVHWKSQFEVGTKTNTVVLTGANYHGLGMRFSQQLDPVADHFFAEGKPDLTGTKQDVSVHSWEAVAFAAPGKPATIAVFGHPGNARGQANFFSMRSPFAYLSATQGLEREPLVYRKGDTFEFNYLITLSQEVKSAEELSRRAKAWEAQK